MASIARSLQPRRPGNSLDQERENFEKNQFTAINKAINDIEVPVKTKHVRSAIIGTFQEKGGYTFWSNINRLQLQISGNPIVAWKFCHTLHKVLREGHPNAVQESHKHRTFIEETGKLWSHLKEGYGKLIKLYCNLLVAKLDFHRKNPRFPGNLMINDRDLELICENDINNYFQLSVEIFDYMDEILLLQGAVFGSLDMSRSNSMTSAGQCRLSPLIPCIQDSSQLYDFTVKILFKLHNCLPPDTLVGHRDRFLKQFKALRQFYLQSSTLQYFKTLIQVPQLGENPPNFLISSELSHHVTPVVILPPEPSQPQIDDTLVRFDQDFSEGSVADSSRNGSISPDLLAERDRYIEQLLHQIEQLTAEIELLRYENQRKIGELRQVILEMEQRLTEKENEIREAYKAKEDIEQKLSEAAQSAQQGSVVQLQLQETEKRSKVLEEKFTKMKDVYQKLRDEHITLLRQKAETDKKLAVTNSALEQSNKANRELQETVEQAQNNTKEVQEELNALTQAQEEKMALLSQDKEELNRVKLELQVKGQELEEQVQQTTSQLLALQNNNTQLNEDIDQLKKNHEAALSLMKKKSLQKFQMLLVECAAKASQYLDKCIRDLMKPPALGLPGQDQEELSSKTALSLLDSLANSLTAYVADSNEDTITGVIPLVFPFAQSVGYTLLQGQQWAHTLTDIDKADKLLDKCKTAGCCSKDLTTVLQQDFDQGAVNQNTTKVRNSLEELNVVIETLAAEMRGNADQENVGQELESELVAMERAIEEAALRIAKLWDHSKGAHTGVKLEVNEKILDSCTELMRAIIELIRKAKVLQEEIVARGKGSATAKEFYKRNHRWTEGLLSAAKAVGFGAKLLTDAADKVVQGQVKFEQLTVASQEIAASTAQLVFASRVKADMQSKNLKNLSEASKAVSVATGGVVAAAKHCAQLVEDSSVMDFSELTLHQAKRLEMESQVKVLELESSLEKERMRLSQLRKKHYQLAEENNA